MTSGLVPSATQREQGLLKRAGRSSQRAGVHDSRAGAGAAPRPHPVGHVLVCSAYCGTCAGVSWMLNGDDAYRSGCSKPLTRDARLQSGRSCKAPAKKDKK